MLTECARLVSPLLSVIDQLKYFLCEEKCRICSRIIHPKIRYMDKERYAAPGHYLIAGRRFTSSTLCQECCFTVGSGTPVITTLPLSQCRSLKVFSATAFSGHLKKLIHGFKYNGDLLMSGDLSSLLHRAWQAYSEDSSMSPAVDMVIVPVPLHWWRMRQRGFNQSEILAKQLSRRSSLKISYKALKRTKMKRPQQELTRRERLENVKGVFRANPKLVEGKIIILIDDVCTTGATLKACAEELMKKGARKCVALTLAKVD